MNSDIKSVQEIEERLRALLNTLNATQHFLKDENTEQYIKMNAQADILKWVLNEKQNVPIYEKERNYLMNNTFIKDRELRKNASGCNDPTAYQAIHNIDEEEEAFKKLFRTLRYICNVAGFEFDGRVSIRNKESGRVYK